MNININDFLENNHNKKNAIMKKKIKKEHMENIVMIGEKASANLMISIQNTIALMKKQKLDYVVIE